MNPQQKASSKAQRDNPLERLFLYHLIALRPMSQRQRDKWAETRTRGLRRYLFISTILNAIFCSFWFPLISFLFGTDPDKLPTQLIIGAASGAFAGACGGYGSWYHNEVEFNNPDDRGSRRKSIS